MAVQPKQNLLQRADAGAWLAAWERAIYKAYQTIQPSMEAAVVAAVVQTLASGQNPSYTTLAVAGGTAALVTGKALVVKFLEASKDPTVRAVGQAVDSVGDTIEARLGINQAKQPITPPDATPAAA